MIIKMSGENNDSMFVNSDHIVSFGVIEKDNRDNRPRWFVSLVSGDIELDFVDTWEQAEIKVDGLRLLMES